MAQDNIAFHGFHKMFKHFWNVQLENMHKVMKYELKRGVKSIIKEPIVSQLKVSSLIFRNILIIIETDNTKQTSKNGTITCS
jgi:hypothetical protein